MDWIKLIGCNLKMLFYFWSLNWIVFLVEKFSKGELKSWGVIVVIDIVIFAWFFWYITKIKIICETYNKQKIRETYGYERYFENEHFF